jgi:hypothetical protein
VENAIRAKAFQFKRKLSGPTRVGHRASAELDVLHTYWVYVKERPKGATETLMKVL